MSNEYQQEDQWNQQQDQSGSQQQDQWNQQQDQYSSQQDQSGKQQQDQYGQPQQDQYGNQQQGQYGQQQDQSGKQQQDQYGQSQQDQSQQQDASSPGGARRMAENQVDQGIDNLANRIPGGEGYSQQAKDAAGGVLDNLENQAEQSGGDKFGGGTSDRGDQG